MPEQHPGLKKIAQAVQTAIDEQKPVLNAWEADGLSKNIVYKILQREKFEGKGYEISSLLDCLDRLGLEIEIKPTNPTFSRNTRKWE